MGIRFSCHGCGKPLNIKNELAGRRGVCPDCKIRFRIPLQDAEYSSPIEAKTAQDATAPQMTTPVVAQQQQAAGATDSFESESGATAVAERPREESPAAAEAAPISEPASAPVASSATSAPASTPPTASAAKSNAPAPANDPLDLLADDAAATWYVRPPSGGQYGPATGDVLKAWIEEGRVAKNALLWRDGWPQWRDASEVLPEMAESLPGGNQGDSFGGSDGRSSGAIVKQDAPVSGSAAIGATRRKRSSQRVTLIAVLAAVVIGLLVTLLVVANMRGG